MEGMEQIKEMLCEELEELAQKGEMSAGDLDVIYKLIVAKEKLLRIEELEEELGYSEEGSMSGDSYRRSGAYRNGSSRRSRNAYGNGSYARRTSRGSYSMATEDPRGKMQELLRTTDLTDEQRQFIQRAMEM